MLASDIITFEQAADDLTKMALRFEHLYQLAVHQLSSPNHHSTEVALVILMDILRLVERPDLRSKIYQEQSRLLNHLTHIRQQSAVDNDKVNQIIDQLQESITIINRVSGKFANKLRYHHFLKEVAQYYDVVRNTNDFLSPNYQRWLGQSVDARQQQLIQWYTELNPFADIVKTILKIYRQSAQPVEQQAKQGFFQTTVDPQQPCHLIQVRLQPCDDIFPRISIGRHGISIRFMQGDIDTPSVKTTQDVTFILARSSL